MFHTDVLLEQKSTDPLKRHSETDLYVYFTIYGGDLTRNLILIKRTVLK